MVRRPKGARLASQLTFLVLFFVLLTLTVWPLGRLYLGGFLVADPLIAVNSVANGVWKWPMLLAVLMLAAPLVFGRGFCGWVCPMGTLLERLGPGKRSRVSRSARGLLRLHSVMVLVVCAGFLLFGSGAFLLLDPLSMLTRSATTLVYPVLDRGVRLAGDLVYAIPPLRPAVDAVTSALSGRLVFGHPLVYGLSLFALMLVAALFALSFLEPRLWCRYFCPLGALLSLPARRSALGRVVDPEKCTRCGACARTCPMGAVGDDFQVTDTSRCQLGFECADACPAGAISFGRRPARVSYSPSRRSLVAASGLALSLGFLTFTGLGRRKRDPRLVRPPGAVRENRFLALCSRCGQCMKVCPTNVLQPALSRAGVEGVFTPQMDFEIGYCDWSCNECGKVCPTGAIAELSLAKKHRTRVGRAYIDRDRCIPWADYETCLVCQELCPVQDKAIEIVNADVRDAEGRPVTIGRPEVVAERCIGCGVCENACPVPHQAAIQVRAIDESAPGARETG